MNVGLYSFKNIELIKTSNFISKLNKFLNLDNIFLYSENTSREKMNQRFGFKKLLEDYDAKIIDIIVFEDTKSLGSDNYIRSQIYKILLSGDYEFYFLNENLSSSEKQDRIFLKYIIDFEESLKTRMDKRSKIGQYLKEKYN